MARDCMTVRQSVGTICGNHAIGIQSQLLLEPRSAENELASNSVCCDVGTWTIWNPYNRYTSIGPQFSGGTALWWYHTGSSLLNLASTQGIVAPDATIFCTHSDGYLVLGGMRHP